MATTDEGRIRDILLLHNAILRDLAGETVDNDSFRDLMIGTLDDAREKIKSIRVRGDKARQAKEAT